jgi:chromosome segregation ATPase
MDIGQNIANIVIAVITTTGAVFMYFQKELQKKDKKLEEKDKKIEEIRTVLELKIGQLEQKYQTKYNELAVEIEHLRSNILEIYKTSFKYKEIFDKNKKKFTKEDIEELSEAYAKTEFIFDTIKKKYGKN